MIPPPSDSIAGAPDPAARRTGRGPAGGWLLALVLGAAGLAFAWPPIIHASGLPLDAHQMAVLASATHSALALLAAVLLVRAVRGLRGRAATAWALFAVAMAVYTVANAGWTVTAALGTRLVHAGPVVHVWDGCFIAANVLLLAGLVALPPSANRSASVRHIDTAIMMVAATCLLWVLPISSMLRRIEQSGQSISLDASVDSVTFGAYALLDVVILLVAMGALARCRPDARGEIRPAAMGAILMGLGDLVFSVSPTDGYTAVARTADAFYVAGLTLLVVAAHRLGGPPSPQRPPARPGAPRRIRPAVAELATLIALAALAVHQQVWHESSLVSILLGTVLVLLAIARLGQLEFEQRTLTRSLRATADRLYEDARLDSLTGTGNRLGLDERLRDSLARAAAHPDAPGVSVFFVDIDHFKRINDGLGHHVGDELLVACSARLRDVFGDGVYRVGGDEFVAVRDDLDPAQAEALASATVTALEPAFVIEDLELNVTTSIGLARSVRREGDRRQRARAEVDPTGAGRPADRREDTAGALLQRADLALYQAKELGRGRWAVYEPALQDLADARLDLQQGVDLAIERHEMEVHYQPVVALGTGRMVGLLACLRWRSPRHGVLLPETFMPAATEGGLLQALDALLLDDIAETLQLIAASEDPGLWIGVDLGRQEIVHPGLLARIASTLRTSGVAPDKLRVRVSEETIADETARQVMRQLSDLGVQLTVTRFGTGPSSLVQLSHYPASSIEVDASFVEGLGRRRDDSIIVTAVAGLTADLGLQLAASGISEEFQVEMLAEMGCAHGVGRLFGEPVTRAEFFAGWFHVRHDAAALHGDPAGRP